ncbi:hypothetical protein CHISP_2421 [Chitinispirillum alkaliphilum]|nr:hypothetical protein CHISP_2421 [Chitinispirillum alkaliphilum]
MPVFYTTSPTNPPAFDAHFHPLTAPTCSQAGIFGAVAGIRSTIQALEAIKLLGDFGKCLTNTVQFFEADNMRFHKVAIHKRSDCPVCSPDPT